MTGNDAKSAKPLERAPAPPEEMGPRQESTFDRCLRDFAAQIHSLFVTLPLTVRAVGTAFKKTYAQFQAFEKENVRYEKENGQELTLVKMDCVQEYDDLTKQLRAYGLASTIIPNSFIMSLISQYDAFLGRIIRGAFLAKPDLLNSSDRKLSLAQLLAFESVSTAREYILEKEIESVLRDSHVDHFDWMESRFNLPLRKDLPVWPEFVEITERRNLFVHAAGVVSNQYMTVCKEQGVALGETKLGDTLRTTPSYFKRAYDVLFELGIKLGHVLWRKFSPEEMRLADSNLIEIGYQYALYDRNYPLTQAIFDFGARTLKKHSSEENRLFMIVNEALGYKWGGDNVKALDIVQGEDWSATRARFRLAEAVLRDDYDKAFKIMREIGSNFDEIQKEHYRTWPLFNAIRGDPRFTRLFEEIYHEPYNKVEPGRVVPPESLEPSTE